MEWIVLAAALVLFYLLKMRGAKGVSNITAAELENRLNDRNAFFLDVRTNGEFKGRHIRGFKNIPLGSDYSKLPHDKEIIVICQSGMRSQTACKQLKKLGYANVTNVRGGMNSWRG
ncbi:rhodanese-like domain-containing protein [Pradoshia sp.]|uniref:rhodanese-like domain-containing protein n=1 Tax=Pradoshia sp. TaxID=2651281 RepID=UPI003F07E2BD